jgi:hypothetical protein
MTRYWPQIVSSAKFIAMALLLPLWAVEVATALYFLREVGRVRDYQLALQATRRLRGDVPVEHWRDWALPLVEAAKGAAAVGLLEAVAYGCVPRARDLHFMMPPF